jgi:ABC-type transport system involved in cytochrome bd biosynthesis fused ATPase/permease subunit
MNLLQIILNFLSALDLRQKLYMSFLVFISMFVSALELVNIKIASLAIPSILENSVIESKNSALITFVFDTFEPMEVFAYSMLCLVIVRFLYNILVTSSSVSIGRVIQAKLLENVLNLENAEFNRCRVGEHSSNLLHKVNMLVSGVYLPVIRVMSSAFTLVFVLFGLFQESSVTFFIFTGLIAFLLSVILLSARSARRLSTIISNNTDRVSNELLLLLAGRREIMINRIYSKLVEAYLDQDRKIRQAHFAVQIIQITPKFVVEFGIGLLLLILAFNTIHEVSNAAVSGLLFSILIVQRLIPPAIEFQTNLVSIYSNAQAVSDVVNYGKQHLWNIPMENTFGSQFISRKKISGETKITLKKITTYNNDRAVHTPLNVEISSGITRISGRNGSGKSSLIDVIIGARSHSASVRGEIEFSIKHNDHQNYFSLCSQDPVVIPGNLCENLTPGSDERQAEQLARVFELPTTITSNLSGGEKQKLGIIRAVCSRAPIVILDEPSSALDASSVKKLNDLLLAEQKQDRIYILITHDERLQNAVTQTIELANASFDKI